MLINQNMFSPKYTIEVNKHREKYDQFRTTRILHLRFLMSLIYDYEKLCLNHL